MAVHKSIDRPEVEFVWLPVYQNDLKNALVCEQREEMFDFLWFELQPALISSICGI